MQSKDLQALRQQIKKRQTSLKLLDEKIESQLTKKTLLQDLYYDDINASSLSSNTEMSNDGSFSQSKLSVADASASIDSSFLQDQISKVRDYLQKNNANKTVGETTMFTKDEQNMKNTLQHDKNRRPQYIKKDQTQQSYFFKPVKQQISEDYQLFEEKRIQNQKKMKFIRQLQETKQRQIGKYLDQKQNIRQKEIERERLAIRAQLIRSNEQRQMKKLQEAQTIKRKRVDTIVYQEKNVSLYQIQRNRALSTLLKQTQRESRRADKILSKTRNLIFS